VVGLVLAALGSALFVVAYAFNWSTQVLGGALGGTLVVVGVALVVVGKRLIVTEELLEPYPEVGDPEEQENVARIVRDVIDRDMVMPGQRQRILELAGRSA